MPDDGIELIREVKAIAEAKGIHVPAIAVTPYRGRREELLAELVEKPLDPLTLCKVVRQHARLHTERLERPAPRSDLHRGGTTLS
jgi:hypothetical protein